MPATPGQNANPESSSSEEPSVTRRAAESFVRNAEATSPLGALGANDELRDRTVSAVQRILDASLAKNGDHETRTEKLLRRYDATRQELSAANFELAAAWRIGNRAPAPLRAIARLRASVQAAQERAEMRPDGLNAMKQYEVVRYRRELDTTRFAVTPSREAALEELLEAVVQGRPVLMLGPSGTGKTTIVRELARRLQSDLEIIPGNEVTAGQLWGTRGLDPVRGDVIRDGIVARAMVEGDGKLLLWDEANASDEAMEKFLKFKVYLTTRAGDAVRVPAENPELRRVGRRFGFILTGNPKGQKHTNRAEFPPEIARELGEVRLEYLPEEEMYDLALAGLVESDVVRLGNEELRTDGVLHNLVKLVREVQGLYLGESAARGVAGAPTLRKLVIDPGMVTAWLTGWSYARAARGESLASYLDRQLVALANSEKYPAEDRMLIVQTAARFHFLAHERAKNALRVPGLASTTLAAFTPFAPALYAHDRDIETPLREAIAVHPYVERRLGAHFTKALNDIVVKSGQPAAKVQSILIGSTVSERLQELQTLLKATPEELAQALEVQSAPTPDIAPPPGASALTPDRAIDLTRERWSVAELRYWLTMTSDKDGNTLESRLEGGSLDAQLNQVRAAYADGEWGFNVDISSIEIPVSPEYLRRLKEGIECGAINGVVVEAYPSSNEAFRMIEKQSPMDVQQAQQAFDRVMSLPAVEFLINHFEKRGVTIYEWDRRIAKWNTLRSVAVNGSPLWKVFHDSAPLTGSTPSEWTDANGSRSPKYIELHKAVFDAGLMPPKNVSDVAGTATLTFTNVKREVTKKTKILGADGVSTLKQGNDLTFVRMMQEKIDTLTPTESLALTSAIADPKKIETYPAPATWEWLASIDDTCAARACSGSGGLRLGWAAPGSSSSDFRVRSVVR
jgi:energy-coupling factor transporter ATP-binding protein EcfA2